MNGWITIYTFIFRNIRYTTFEVYTNWLEISTKGKKDPPVRNLIKLMANLCKLWNSKIQCLLSHTRSLSLSLSLSHSLSRCLFVWSNLMVFDGIRKILKFLNGLIKACLLLVPFRRLLQLARIHRTLYWITRQTRWNWGPLSAGVLFSWRPEQLQSSYRAVTEQLWRSYGAASEQLQRRFRNRIKW